ncbi:MAG: CHASE3 domain-containing protein [Saprospiraceae bacterium]|nr:CHASE3 domain-containing protein [Saprospiraceae bacterium]
MNKNLSPKQVLMLFAVVLAFLITVAALAYIKLVSLVDTNERTNRNTEFVLKLEEIMSYLKDAETGSRGFLLTSDTLFLRPQKLAGKQVANLVLDLRSDTKNIDEQIPYLDSIQNMSTRKINNIWQLVHSIKPGQVNPLTDNQKQMIENGRLLMDSIRATIQNLKKMEQNRLNFNIEKQKKSTADSPRFFLIIIILAVAVIIMTMFGIYQQLLLVNKARKNLEQKINELDHANRELDQYAFTLSHHLQEPLRKIRMFSSRYENKLKKREVAHDNDKAKNTEGVAELETIRKINALATDSQQLLNEFLAFANLGQKDKTEPVRIHLPDLLHRVWLAQKEMVKTAQANYTFEGIENIVGSESRIELLFNQLIDNALKFHHPERPLSIHIESGQELVENTLFHAITIRDNGIGFEPEYAQKIFLLFQKLNAKTNDSGLGVGLAICRKIVELHNGSIVATSQPDFGTTIKILLPMPTFHA